jgi:hypothetical protein
VQSHRCFPSGMVRAAVSRVSITVNLAAHHHSSSSGRSKPGQYWGLTPTLPESRQDARQSIRYLLVISRIPMKQLPLPSVTM